MLVGDTTITRLRLLLTDNNPVEHDPFSTCTNTDECYKLPIHMLCVFHRLVLTLQERVYHLLPHNCNGPKQLTATCNLYGEDCYESKIIWQKICPHVFPLTFTLIPPHQNPTIYLFSAQYHPFYLQPRICTILKHIILSYHLTFLRWRNPPTPEICNIPPQLFATFVALQMYTTPWKNARISATKVTSYYIGSWLSVMNAKQYNNTNTPKTYYANF